MTLTNPGGPPFGDASRDPAVSPVAMTRNGDCAMNARE
jgi:hypothetical protein